MAVPETTNEQRAEQILDVFDTAFGELLAADPAAFQVKFRKMAASAFAFYRGTACLFYADLERDRHGGPFLDERTGRVWIHGDLHAENFGTYMDSNGRLVFNVNDFDEAYVGPFTWDLKRFAASVALIGYTKALSDEQIGELVRTYAGAYRERIHRLATGAKYEEVPSFTLDTADGPLLTALRSARSRTRFSLLDSMTEIRDYERRFTSGGARSSWTRPPGTRCSPPSTGTWRPCPTSPWSGRTPTGSRTWWAAAASGSARPACPRTTSCSKGTATPWRTTS